MKSKSYWLLLILFCGFAVFPILWGIRTSFSPEYEQSVLPSRLTVEHYRRIVTQSDFYRYALNSAMVSVGVLVVVAPLSLAAGYALARFRFWGSKAAPLMLALPLLPVVTFLVPMARYLNVIGLYDNLAALILANAAFCTPFAVWIMRNFVHTVPSSLEEAALLDGCGRLALLWQLCCPARFRA